MGVMLLFACLSILIFVLCLLCGGSHGWIRTARSSSFRLDLFKVLLLIPSSRAEIPLFKFVATILTRTRV